MGKLTLGILFAIAVIAWHLGRGVGTAVNSAKAGFASTQQSEATWISQNGRIATDFCRKMGVLQREIINYCGPEAGNITLEECHAALVRDGSPDAKRLAHLLEDAELELQCMNPEIQKLVMGAYHVATHRFPSSSMLASPSSKERS